MQVNSRGGKNMYKIKNLTEDPRKVRIHKTAKAYFLRAGEQITVPYPPIVANPSIFEVTNLDEINEKEEALKPVDKKIVDKKKPTKLEE